jgi:hypothetical protein
LTWIFCHFAWAKRYFGLETACWKGLDAAYQHTALVYRVMLGVALTAHRFQHPELVGSRMKVPAIHVPACITESSSKEKCEGWKNPALAFLIG